MLDQGVASHGLARFRAADAQQMASRKRPAKVVIETDHAVHLGAGKIESVGDQRNRGVIQVAELVLQSVQDRQEGAGEVLQLPDPNQGSIRVPGWESSHFRYAILYLHRVVKRNILSVPIHKVEAGAGAAAQDLVAVEEPLQIRLADRDIAITMRTPGHDRELAAGFLFTEAILRQASQISGIAADEKGAIDVQLAEGVAIDFGPLARNFYVTSSCGVCGKASIDALRAAGCPTVPRGRPVIDARILPELPRRLREAQAVFEHTGGLHAAGLFDISGKLLGLREDVGRHNAVDKLVGAAFLEDRLPLGEHILMLSGRISFELVQKALMAGIPIVAAVGAPSSLAIETALRFGMTLVGFLRSERFNVYAGQERLSQVQPG